MLLNIRASLFRERDRVSTAVPRILFVDPGLCGTGWAFFEALNTRPERKTKTSSPKETGVLKIPASKYKDGWVQHVQCIAASFRGILAAYKPEWVVLEQPELWASSKSHAATVSKNGEAGDIFKLTYLIGAMGLLVHQTIGKTPVLIFPREWKGQLDKGVVIARIEGEIGITPRDHEADAVGMGLAAQGRL